MLYQHQREEVAYIMRRLYRQGLTTTSGGNVSCRTPHGDIVLSASKSDKARLRPEQVGILAVDGRNLTPDLSPSIEAPLHLAIYRERPDVQAIVHAHPVTATAFCTAGTRLDTHLTAEAYAVLGDPLRVPYACMGTMALAEQVAQAMTRHTCCALLQNHGILTVGPDLLTAFDRLEVLEVAARQTLIVRQLDDVTPLGAHQRRELDRFVERSPQNEEPDTRLPGKK